GSEVLKVADLVLDPASMRATRSGTELQLSPIGMKLLTILMRESPRVVNRQEIQRATWGHGLPDSATLLSHLSNLRKIIDNPFGKPLLHTVQSAGYRIADIDQSPACGRRSNVPVPQGLPRKIRYAFVVQGLLLVLAVVFGVSVLTLFTRDAIVQQRLLVEAEAFWERVAADAPRPPLPRTRTLGGHYRPAGRDVPVPPEVESLAGGVSYDYRAHRAVLVDRRPEGELYLVLRTDTLDQ